MREGAKEVTKLICAVCAQDGIISNIELNTTFKLVNANSNYEIINQLIYGAPEVKKVMILEGWTLNQIANNLQNELQFDSLEIINLFRYSSF